MNRQNTALANTIFFVIAPGLVAWLIPWLITDWSAPDTSPYFIGLLVGLGGLLIGGGLLLLIDSFMRFVSEGNGTPMPWMPTDKVIARGAYRFLRNPMYVGIIVIVLGQAILFANGWLVAYAAFVWLLFHLLVTLIEEPGLGRSFGAAYAAYIAAVPRWFPRVPPPANSIG